MKHLAMAVLAVLVATSAPASGAKATRAPEFYGTTEPFASSAIYFVLTDRFVNGDPGNDQRNQGGKHHTFDIPVPGAPSGKSANIGYLGGDFKGIVENAAYIRGMGFGAVWITPIVDNPDTPFTGGSAVHWGGSLTDKGKTGFHGYWGINFYKVDEHLPSKNLDYAQFTAAMHKDGLKVVQDIVLNHGSPAFSMPTRQPQYGQIFDKSGKLIADEQNLPPYKLDPRHNPLHSFYHAYSDLAQLSNNDDDNPAVLDYFVGAYNQWASEGADAFRIDTIMHVGFPFLRQFAKRIRAEHPGIFMFGETFDTNADDIGKYTWPQNGGFNDIDFPLKERMVDVFEHPKSDYAELLDRLYLTNGPYTNPYDMVTFYDNHDMARLNASDNGFIDANNWLFTARGIPVIYYGSEIGFERGMAEHEGNRNYFGQQRIDNAPKSPIYQHLAKIARLRARTPALQRGLMLPIQFKNDQASFYRVYQKGDVHQIVLVLLNKGEHVAQFAVTDRLQAGVWKSAFEGRAMTVAPGGTLQATVAPHDVQVYLLDAAVARPDLVKALTQSMQDCHHPMH